MSRNPKMCLIMPSLRITFPTPRPTPRPASLTHPPPGGRQVHILPTARHWGFARSAASSPRLAPACHPHTAPSPAFRRPLRSPEELGEPAWNPACHPRQPARFGLRPSHTTKCIHWSSLDSAVFGLPSIALMAATYQAPFTRLNSATARSGGVTAQRCSLTGLRSKRRSPGCLLFPWLSPSAIGSSLGIHPLSQGSPQFPKPLTACH